MQRDLKKRKYEKTKKGEVDFSWKDRGSLLAHLPSARALSSCPHLCQLLLTLLLNLVSGRTSSEVFDVTPLICSFPSAISFGYWF